MPAKKLTELVRLERAYAKALKAEHKAVNATDRHRKGTSAYDRAIAAAWKAADATNAASKALTAEREALAVEREAAVVETPAPGPADLLPGARVRCEYRAEHVGTVLADDDPRAWAGTIAFPEAAPDPAAVRAHVAKYRDTFRREVRRPVLWDFGKVFWDYKLTPAARVTEHELDALDVALGHGKVA